MKKKLNCDPRYNPKTTIMGVILMISALSVEIGVYFIDLKQETINHWIVGSIGVLGLLLFIAPDKVITVVENGFNAMIKKVFS